MGLAFGLEKGQCNQADLGRAVKMVPKALEPYVLGKVAIDTVPLIRLHG